MPTEAGDRLLRTIGPRFEEIEAKLAATSELREKPASTHPHHGHGLSGRHIYGPGQAVMNLGFGSGDLTIHQFSAMMG
jgi:hypothetical protein